MAVSREVKNEKETANMAEVIDEMFDLIGSAYEKNIRKAVRSGIKTLPIRTVIFDKELNILESSHEAEEFFGDCLSGKNVGDIITEASIEKLKEMLITTNLLDTDKRKKYQLTVDVKEGVGTSPRIIKIASFHDELKKGQMVMTIL